MRSRAWVYQRLFVALIIFGAAVTVALVFYNKLLFAVAGVLWLALAVYTALGVRNMQKNIRAMLLSIGQTLTTTQRDALAASPLPVMVTSVTGEVIWYNNLCRKNVLASEEVHGHDLSALMPMLDPNSLPSSGGTDVTYKGHMYTVFTVRSATGSKPYLVHYFVDDTALKQTEHEYQESRESVGIVVIDNYDELTQNAGESEAAQAIARLEYLIMQYIENAKGFFRRLERGKYLVILEERHLRPLLERRFDLLDKAREVMVGESGMPATLSIGVGRGAEDLREAEKMAMQALEMALGRGGDQAAIKTPGGFEFFGGVSKGVEKRTKVKTRIVASALTELIQGSDNVLIMGHRFGDLDCLGAAIGLSRGVRNLGKQANIVVDREHNLAKPLYDRMLESGYSDVFVEPAAAQSMITKRTLLIIVDTHIEHILESAEVYRACRNVVIVDHHRKTVGHIDRAVIFYHEPYASSAAEMITELLQYFGDAGKIGRTEAEALLAGIMLDTKNFVLRTGVRTFEAAAYLRRQGADTVEVRKLFASTMESYQHKTRLVASAEVYRSCAIACGASGEDMQLVAPQAADELLGINGVDASFVLYELGDGVSISARSMGALNVQLIMEALGGGGHHTMAGAQISGISLEAARQKLLVAIDNYYSTKNK